MLARYFGVYPRVISQKMLQLSCQQLSYKITFLKIVVYLPWNKELIYIDVCNKRSYKNIFL